MSAIFTDKVLRLPADAFPNSFHADVAAYSAWASGQKRMGGVPPNGLARGQRSFNSAKPICARTLVGHQSAIYLAASALARSGVEPSAITSITHVVRPESVQTLLDEIAGRGQLRAKRRNSSYQTKNFYSTVIAQRLRSIALNWCSDLLPRRADYQEIIARVRPLRNIQQGMSRKNADRLKQFDQPGVLRKWFALPELLVQRAEMQRIQTKVVTPRMIVDIQAAVALALLQTLPMRGANLACLRIGKHPHIVFTRQGANLLIRGEEVKNRRDLSAQIGGRALSVLMLYATRYLEPIRKRRGADHDNPFLFPGAGMRRKTLFNLSDNITSRAREICRVQLNLHLLRHLAAKIIVDRAPRELGVVAGLLGHAHPETTERFYLSPDKSALRARYRRLINPISSGEDENTGDDGKVNHKRRDAHDLVCALQEAVAADPQLLRAASSFGYKPPPCSVKGMVQKRFRKPAMVSAALYAFGLFARDSDVSGDVQLDAETRIAQAIDQFVKRRRQQHAELTVLANLESLTRVFRALGLERESAFLLRYTRIARHAACFPGKGGRTHAAAWRKFDGWPTDAKQAWLRLTAPSPEPAPTTKGALHYRPRWAARTERRVHYTYSRFLRLMGSAGMPAYVTPDSVQRFIDDHASRGLSIGSICSSIRDLHGAARIAEPDADFTWLRDEVNRLKHLTSRDVGRRNAATIDPAQIWAAGRTLIARARATGEADHGSALLFRDGLILCMATAVPVRIDMLARFAIQHGAVVFETSDGEMAPVELQHWPEVISDAREFGARYRPLFLPEHPERALFLSALGRPRSRRQFFYIFRERSTQLLGSAASLGALRAGVVELFLCESPEHIGDAAIVLGYYGTAVQERLRARANQLISQEKAAQILEAEIRLANVLSA